MINGIAYILIDKEGIIIDRYSGADRMKSYHWVYLTAALKGKYVAIQNMEKGIW